MKPADHPEFFRLPPPPGASRESTISLDREGRFHHDGQPVERPALEQALRSWVAAHPDDGRPILTNGYDWTYFHVEDAPLRVDALRFEEVDGAVTGVTLVLFDGSEEPLDPRSLRLGGDVLYARARGGALEARFSRGAQADLGRVLASADPPEIEVGGIRFPVLPR